MTGGHVPAPVSICNPMQFVKTLRLHDTSLCQGSMLDVGPLWQGCSLEVCCTTTSDKPALVLVQSAPP